MFGLGEGETLVIILAILLLFGAKRIPDVARSLGSGIREFRRAMRSIQDEVTTAVATEHEPAAPAAPGAPAAARSGAPAVAASPPPAPPILPPPEQSAPRTPPTPM